MISRRGNHEIVDPPSPTCILPRNSIRIVRGHNEASDILPVTSVGRLALLSFPSLLNRGRTRFIMAWFDDLREAYDMAQPSWPYPWMEAWANVESKSNSHEEAPLGEQSRGEVGWGQIHPGTARELDIDIDRVLTDPVYSIQQWARMMDSYAERVPSSFTGTAWWGMVKLWHSLPLEAKVVTERLGSAGTWKEVYDWIQANLTSADLVGKDGKRHDPMRWANNVQKVIDSAGILPDAITVTGIGPITAIVLIVSALALVGLVAVYA